MGDVYWISNELVHTLFAIKYWALSKKIFQLLTGKPDKNLNCKVKIILSFQIALILVLQSIDAVGLCTIFEW